MLFNLTVKREGAWYTCNVPSILICTLQKMRKLEEGLFGEIVSRKAGFEHVLVNLNREG